jgi:hypothetical protein
MQPLNEAIAAVLREVSRGCAADRSPLKPERVRLTLNFALEAGRPPRADAAGPHSVTVEFAVGAAGEWQPVASPTQAPPAEPAAAPHELVPLLAQVFGVPGFDSSARATVFRETLAGMTPVEVEAVMAALTTPLAGIADERRRQAVHILRGVIHSGPTKQVERGAELLRRVFANHPLAEVMRVVESEWKTQDAWLG